MNEILKINFATGKKMHFFCIFLLLMSFVSLTVPFSEAAANEDPVLESAKLIRVIPGTGNNPFNVNDPTAGGSTIGNTQGRRINPLAPDIIPPVVTPPVSITVPVAVGNVTGVPATNPIISTFLLGARAVDNIDGVIPPAAITNNAPAIFPVGVTVVTFFARDRAGNIGTATGTVRVNQAADTIPPVVTPPPPLVITFAAVAPAPVPRTDPRIQIFLNGVTAFDNVDGVIPPAAITNNAPAIFPVGVTVVTFFARDRGGNVGMATGTVRIQ